MFPAPNIVFIIIVNIDIVFELHIPSFQSYSFIAKVILFFFSSLDVYKYYFIDYVNREKKGTHRTNQ